jgi:hypothetical protein
MMSMSSSFVLGSLHLVPYHLYGVKVWTFRWPHVPPVDVIVPHKVFGHLRPMFWVIVLLEPVNIWKLHLDVWQKVISDDAVSEEFLLHDVLKIWLVWTHPFC